MYAFSYFWGNAVSLASKKSSTWICKCWQGLDCLSVVNLLILRLRLRFRLRLRLRSRLRPRPRLRLRPGLLPGFSSLKKRKKQKENKSKKRKNKKEFYEPPGGNQVDGLPPAFSRVIPGHV